MREIAVAVTMDCEPTLATTHGSATGPKDFAMSERAILGYFEIARSYDFQVTYFVHPETILAQADLFKHLMTRGACIGLHIHPWKYSQWRYGGKRYMGHLGQFSYDEQVTLLSEAATLWHHAMGERPLYFRPGTFSANDTTFRALLQAGFRGGSVSAPERVFREIYSVWTGAEPDAHRTNAEFRLVPGGMKLVNVPLSADFSNPVDIGPGRRMHADLRPDIDWLGRFGITYRTIAENILAQIGRRDPAVPAINIVSHNQFEYSDRSDPVCQRYLTALDELSGACGRGKLHATGVTIDAIVDQVLRTEPVGQDFVYM
jgi:hypothetical protein